MGHTVADKNRELLARQYKVTGVFLSFADAQILRKAELTLHAWDAKRCGWSTSGPYGASFALVRDEDGDNKPYIEIHPNVGLKTRWQPIPDLEAGALRRIEEVCERNGGDVYGLEFYHQGDPRGCSLYIARAGTGLNSSNYSSYVAFTGR